MITNKKYLQYEKQWEIKCVLPHHRLCWHCYEVIYDSKCCTILQSELSGDPARPIYFIKNELHFHKECFMGIAGEDYLVEVDEHK